MLMVRSFVQIVWGARLQSFSKGIDLPWIVLDTFRIFPKHLVIVCAALLLMLAVHLLLSRTRAGKAMRAMADSPDLARLTGIDTERVIRTTWIVGAGLAAAAGVFLAYDTHVETQMGFKLLLPDLRLRAARRHRSALRSDGGRTGDRNDRGTLDLSVDRHRAAAPAGVQGGCGVRDHGRDPHLAAERAVPRTGVLKMRREHFEATRL